MQGQRMTYKEDTPFFVFFIVPRPEFDCRDWSGHRATRKQAIYL